MKEIEIDKDELVRTCVVQYRLVRSDLPKEDMRIYFKGLKCKSIRVPVQRLVMILPIEEQSKELIEGNEMNNEDTKEKKQTVKISSLQGKKDGSC